MCSHGECDNGSVAEAVYSPLCRTFLRTMAASMTNGNSTENTTLGGPGKNMSAKHGWFEVVVPMISFLGIVGNILNLIVYTRRRMLSSMDRLEKSATYGLVALALSDMFFCMAVFPHTFVAAQAQSVDANKRYQLYLPTVRSSIRKSLLNGEHLAYCDHVNQSLHSCCVPSSRQINVIHIPHSDRHYPGLRLVRAHNVALLFSFGSRKVLQSRWQRFVSTSTKI